MKRALERFGRVATARRKLIVVAYRLPDRASHYYNELLGYKEAALALGLIPCILVPRTTEPHLAEALLAERVLEPLSAAEHFDPEKAFESIRAFTASIHALEPLWALLTRHDPNTQDIVLFTSGQPGLMAGAGAWLAQRDSRHRPSVFFRVVGDEFIGWLTGRSISGPLFYHLACSDLRTRGGQERVFLLGSSPAIVRKASRAGGRRVFSTALPKYLDFTPATHAARPRQPTVYVHLNPRSGAFVGDLAGIIRRVRANRPSTRFVVKPSGLPAQLEQLLRSEVASLAEILPAQQNTADYLANFQLSTLVLLLYEAKPYETLSSGVFVEAVSSGKPAVVPGGTLMAQQIAHGLGVGTSFEDARAESVTIALQRALANADDLCAAAAALSSRVRLENSSRRYVERMMALIEEAPDMEPRYQLGEGVDFSEVADSHCFMREGWGETEHWGVWTVAHRARLFFRIAERRDLVLRAYVEPFLTEQHPAMIVSISAAEREIAHWVFSLDGPDSDGARWCEARISSSAVQEDDALDISFAIDAPHSPLSEGLSDDPRALGLGLYSMSLH